MPTSPRPASVVLPRLSILYGIWLAVRLGYNGLRQLVPDEAYYWVWSRHLSAGYLDHPPMVAWIIRAGTAVFGTSEFSVRVGAAILSLGTMMIAVRIARRTFSDPNAAKLTAIVLLLGPMFAVLGTIITPDTPAIFFSACALAAALAATRQKPRPFYWLIFGICFGLAMLSKYTTVLLGASVGLALLCSPAGRRQLLTPFPWVSLLIAAAVFSPVIIWNHDHHWASFRFQWNHGTSEDVNSPLFNLGNYFLGQFAVYTPVLLALGIIAVTTELRRFTTLDLPRRMLLISAIFPLLFFAVSSLRHHPEPNWPIFAYVPMTIILANWLAQAWEKRRGLAHLGISIAVGMTIVGHVPEVMNLVPMRLLPNIPSAWEDLYGWRDMGNELSKISGGAPIFCTSYENAAEAAFYVSGRPEVWTVAENRLTAYDFFPDKPQLSSLGKIVCVTRASRTATTADQPPDELKVFSRLAFEPWQTTALGRVIRRRQLIVAEK